MNLLSAHCRVCKGTSFAPCLLRAGLKSYFPRLFLCPGVCICCHKRRYVPTFQHWTAVPILAMKLPARRSPYSFARLH